jgi:hypothetical protein
MYDERESKLPRWAQDALAHERKAALVRFPDQPRPTPDISEPTGHGRAPREQWIYSQNVSGVFAHWVGSNGYLFRSEKEGSFGSQVRGNYYLTAEAALLAHRWHVAEMAAHSMLMANSALSRIIKS